MDLEKNILSDVTQTQKDKYHVLIHKRLLDINQSLLSTMLENIENKEDPKRDIHGSK